MPRHYSKPKFRMPGIESSNLGPMITEAELCEKLGITRATLTKWRSQGEAPPSNKKGRVRFYWDVEKWIKNEKKRQPENLKQPSPKIHYLAAAKKVVPISHFHMHRSKGRPKTDSSCTSCPKCLSNGQVFRSRFQMLDLFALLFALKAVRCPQCMHRFYGKPRNASFASRSAEIEPVRIEPQGPPTLRIVFKCRLLAWLFVRPVVSPVLGGSILAAEPQRLKTAA